MKREIHTGLDGFDAYKNGTFMSSSLDIKVYKNKNFPKAYRAVRDFKAHWESRRKRHV